MSGSAEDLKQQFLKSGITYISDIPKILRLQQFSREEIIGVLSSAIENRKLITYSPQTEKIGPYRSIYKIPLRVDADSFVSKGRTGGSVRNVALKDIKNIFFLNNYGPPGYSTAQEFENRKKNIEPYENIQEQPPEHVRSFLEKCIANQKKFQYIKRRGWRKVYGTQFRTVRHAPFIEGDNLCYYVRNTGGQLSYKKTVPIKDIGFVKVAE